jgi:hypothetical protein
VLIMQKLSVQAPRGVVMIRPHHFSPNAATARPPMFASKWLAKNIAAFCDDHPAIECQIKLAFGPRGTPHHFRNTAATPSRILLGFTPGGIEGFFRESGQPATNDGAAPAVDAAQIARMAAAAPKYGIERVVADD